MVSVAVKDYNYKSPTKSNSPSKLNIRSKQNLINSGNNSSSKAGVSLVQKPSNLEFLYGMGSNMATGNPTLLKSPAENRTSSLTIRSSALSRNDRKGNAT